MTTTTRRRFIVTSLGFVAAAAALPVRARAGEPAPVAPGRTADEVWSELMAGNKRFVAGTPRARNLARARRELARGQRPPAVVLGCSDSRLTPEIIFDQGLGDLFVVRTAGNVADPVALGSIEYAVATLASKVLVVLGHDACGAVRAAVDGKPLPSPNLEAIVRLITPAVNGARTTAGGEALMRVAVEANVGESAKHVLATSPILARAAESGALTVVRAVYRLTSGEVVRLT